MLDIVLLIIGFSLLLLMAMTGKLYLYTETKLVRDERGEPQGFDKMLWYEKGSFIAPMVGISAVEKDGMMTVEPAYRPVVHFGKGKHTVWAEFATGIDTAIVIILTTRFPFIRFARTGEQDD